MTTSRARAAGLAALAALLLASAALAGAFFAADAEALLFSWEASLLPLAALVALSRPGATPAALRAFASCGVGDVALMAGLGLSAHGALPALAFALVCAGALARLAAAPFHGWAIEVAEHAAPPASAFVLAAGKLAGALLLAHVACPSPGAAPPSSSSRSPARSRSRPASRSPPPRRAARGSSPTSPAPTPARWSSPPPSAAPRSRSSFRSPAPAPRRWRSRSSPAERAR